PPSSSISKSHTVKITSPAKGQQVPVGKDLVVSGITGNATGSSTATSHCQVSVIANSVKPYQPATGIGPGGSADYSKWNFVLTSKYTTIKPGPANKITAKYICSNNPSVPSYYSVNVTGSQSATATNTNVSTKQNNQPITINYNSTKGDSTTTNFKHKMSTHGKLIYLGSSQLTDKADNSRIKIISADHHSSSRKPSAHNNNYHYDEGISKSKSEPVSSKPEFKPFILPFNN
ncbi:MAG: hypothetical protein JO297_16985, partial [Nitrososphaeraceae archaeon]|nr:hypothetical protein [Nitrososphaeraceae archaeon]